MTARGNIADMLCIGCQKGSTSWLHSVLNCHPGTWAFPDSEPVTSTNKEAHFWDWNHDRGIDWYRTLLAPPEPEPERMTMDLTPEYALMSDNQIEECKSLNPNAQVIYILRDPMARAVSALRMHILWHYGKDHNEPLTLNDQFFKFMRQANLSGHGDFMRNINAWRRHYPDMLVLNYEDFHTRRVDSVAEIFDRLGLDQSDMSDPQRKRFEGLMNGRVWASEQFPIDRSVLLFLQGLTWKFRQQTQTELGMRFDEGARMIEA